MQVHCFEQSGGGIHVLLTVINQPMHFIRGEWTATDSQLLPFVLLGRDLIHETEVGEGGNQAALFPVPDTGAQPPEFGAQVKAMHRRLPAQLEEARKLCRKVIADDQ